MASGEVAPLLEAEGNLVDGKNSVVGLGGGVGEG